MFLRSLVFLVALLIVLGGAVVAVDWYANSSYFVGLDGNRLAVYQGRPHGVLWFKPHLALLTSYTTASVLPLHLYDLRAGEPEPSITAAQGYITSLVNEARAEKRANAGVGSYPASGSSTGTATTVPAGTTSTVPAGSSATTSTTTGGATS